MMYVKVKDIIEFSIREQVGISSSGKFQQGTMGQVQEYDVSLGIQELSMVEGR